MLKSPELTGSPLPAAGIIGLVCFAVAFWSLAGLKETFGRDLGFVEGYE